MNSIAIKINSFKTQNEVLVNGKPVALNSEFMNYYSKPIIGVVDKLLETAEIEFNDYFDIDVYGNKFEQALVTLVAREFELCQSVTTHDTVVSLGLSDRIALVTAHTGNLMTVGIQLCSDNAMVTLPQISGLQYTDTAEHKVIVSDDLDFIMSNIDNRNRIAFLIGGESRKHGKSYIVGCTATEVEGLIRDYIATCFVNPMIHQIVQSVQDLTSKVRLADCTEPYYYIKAELQMNTSEVMDLPLFSYPEGSDRSCIRLVIKGTSVSADGLRITALSSGNSIIEVYNNAPIPFASVRVSVVSHSYVQRISICVDAPSDMLRTGTSYPLSISCEPVDAEDVSTLHLEISNKKIAHISEGKLVVKKAGIFEITATTSQSKVVNRYTAKNKATKLTLSKPPKKIYIGDMFEVRATLSPNDLFDSSYRWTTSDKNVAVVGKNQDGQEFVKIKGVGNAVITCVSNDDETVMDTMEIRSDSTFNKMGHSQTFLFIGVVAAIAAWYFVLNGGGKEHWISLGISAISLLISILRKEGIGKAMFFMLVAAASVAPSLSNLGEIL